MERMQVCYEVSGWLVVDVRCRLLVGGGSFWQEGLSCDDQQD